MSRTSGHLDQWQGLSWQDHAACTGEDPELFFPTRSELTWEAKAICAGCPVVQACLDHGLRHEHYGIWGGTSEWARRRMRRVAGITVTEPHPTGEPA